MPLRAIEIPTCKSCLLRKLMTLEDLFIDLNPRTKHTQYDLNDLVQSA